MANQLTYSLNLASGAFVAGANRSRQAIAGIGTEAGKSSSLLSSMAAKMTGLAAIVAGSAGAFAGLKKAVTSAADMESTSVAFETLVGDAAKAREVLQQLVQLGADTPFEFPELADAARKLIAFGEGADTVKEALTRMGDVASGIQAPINEIAEIYGKARVQGQLFAEDINQLTGRGIPVIDEMAKIIGVQKDEIKKLGEQGKLSFPLLDQAFRNLTGSGGKFFEMMAKQSQTMKGLWSTLMDNINGIFRAIGQPINDALRPMLQRAIEMADKLGQGVKYAAQILQGAGTKGNLGELIGAGLKAAFSKALEFLASKVPAVVALFDKVSDSMNKGMTGVFAALGGSTAGAVGKALQGAAELAGGFFLSGLTPAIVALGDVFKNALLSAVDIVAEALHLPMKKLAGDGNQNMLESVAGGLKGSGIGKLQEAARDFQKAVGGGDAVKKFGAEMIKANHEAVALFSNLLQGKTKDAMKEGMAQGAHAPGIKEAIAKALGDDGGKKAAKGNADANNDGIVSRREQREFDIAKQRAERRANAIKGGVSPTGWGLGLWNRSTWKADGVDVKGPLQPPTPALDAFAKWQREGKIGERNLDTPGKATRREREKAAAEQRAREQNPKWNKVEEIAATLKNLAVA